MGPKCNHNYLYAREAERLDIHTHRDDGDVKTAQRFKDVGFEDGNDKTTNQEIPAAIRSWTRPGTNSSLEPPEAAQPS